ncbi:hypothetical protein [Methanobacterium sp. ACI-7]|uniref:hypothetical protein n=1 Tax=unclassified Methanobacterium TaxID=2627676 RepID=UPI0039C12274
MENYLVSKVTEYSLLLKWVKKELSILKAEKTEHVATIDNLEIIIQNLESQFSNLNKISKISGTLNESLVSRALSYMKNMEYNLYILTQFYFPALYKENDNDYILRNILLETATECGLFWIKDITVSLDREYSIIPVQVEIPIIYAPPHQCNSIIGMSYFYHEMGHNVFQKFQEELSEGLFIDLNEYFNAIKSSISGLNADQQNKLDEMVKYGKNYWNSQRLNELFCDIYAAFVSGPCYFYSSVDMVIKWSNSPFLLTQDVHPPWAARINACYKTIQHFHSDDDIITKTKNLIDRYMNLQSKNIDFNFICSDVLIDRFVKTSIEFINTYLSTSPCIGSIDYDELSILPNSSILKDVLNGGLGILLDDPSNYIKWEKSALISLSTTFK